MSEERPRYSQNRRLKQAKMQRQVRQSQRRLALFRSYYKLFLILGMILLGYVILKMPQWRLPADAFDSLNSPALEIVNNRIVPSQKILSALRRNQVPTQPIFLVKTDNLKKSITQLEPIQNVYIRRFWFPARLQIIIIERIPVVTISPNLETPPIAFFSLDGKLIGREYMPLTDNYDTVSVITYGSGDDYRNWDVSKVNNFKKLANLVEIETGEKVEYIDYRDPKDVYIKIPSVNVRLGSLNATVFDKIHRLPSLLPQVKMINKKVKYIDLRWDSNFIKLDE
ncbi:MAG: FtsQ-type POTRA domain-containing protein [Cyanobacteria bacterium SIG28]|nr:FtsQ-type POTRA domain-containing protein [Cyanobacteria bacterium SIG28]